jgi:hypothetical protein
MVVPDRIPAKASDFEQERARRRGKAALVPKTTKELSVGKQAAALEGDRPRENVLRDAFESGVKGVPIFLDTVRR